MMIREERALRLIGVFIVLVILWAAMVQVGSPNKNKPTQTADVVTIRFAHWHLEGGVREAFDAVAREYERRNPQVRIVQMAIPEKVYANWVTTQLVGGTAPDLVQMGAGVDATRIARYFTAITESVDAPNPYNVGTSLAGVAWRNTFYDGMHGAYNQDFFDYYGAAPSALSVRVYYNMDLMRVITGREAPPETFDELRAVCEAVRAYAEKTGRVILPIAGSRYNAPMMMDDLFSTQMQRLATELNPGVEFPTGTDELLLSYLRGRWNLGEPSVRRGFELVREVGMQMAHGFMQMGREDATFYFAQGKALMIMTGSWDATSITSSVSFRVGVFKNPAPSIHSTQYGPQMLGVPSENPVGSTGPLGLTRFSKHPEVAVDFLKFLTSKPGNTLFSQRSGWLPVVVGVEVPPLMRGFMPRFDGFPNGPHLRWGSDVRRLLENNEHLLFNEYASVDALLLRLSAELAEAAQADLERIVRDRLQAVIRNETAIEGARQLVVIGESRDAERRLDALIEAQNDNEAFAAYMRFSLEEIAAQPSSR